MHITALRHYVRSGLWFANAINAFSHVRGGLSSGGGTGLATSDLLPAGSRQLSPVPGAAGDRDSRKNLIFPRGAAGVATAIPLYTVL